MRNAAFALAGAVLAGCLGPVPEESDAAEWRRASPLAAVGLLDVTFVSPGWRAETRHGWCGAVLLSSRVILTARSCISVVQRPSDARFTSDFGAALGAAFYSAGDPAAPVVYGAIPDDLAAIVLDHDLPVTDDQLRAIRATPLDPATDVGRGVVFVGYGSETLAPPAGRSSATSSIASIGDGTFELSADGDLPCMYDTGDPVFTAAEIIGVVSHVAAPPRFGKNGWPILCEPQPVTRVDRYLDVIQRALDDAAARKAAEQPAPEPETASTKCPWRNDGECDEGTYCEPGTDPEDCGQWS